jgi:hypothetical protein
MVYNTELLDFLLFPLSDILENRKHDVSGTGFVSIFRSFTPDLRTETDPISETSCFLFSRIPDNGKSPKT